MFEELDQKITVEGPELGVHEFTKQDFQVAVNFAKVLGKTLRIKNVRTCSATSLPDICFGDLRAAGLLDKRYIPGSGAPGDCDPIGSIWTVTGDVEFVDEYGDTHKKGDVITWAK